MHYVLRNLLALLVALHQYPGRSALLLLLAHHLLVGLSCLPPGLSCWLLVSSTYSIAYLLGLSSVCSEIIETSSTKWIKKDFGILKLKTGML